MFSILFGTSMRIAMEITKRTKNWQMTNRGNFKNEFFLSLIIERNRLCGTHRNKNECRKSKKKSLEIFTRTFTLIATQPKWFGWTQFSGIETIRFDKMQNWTIQSTLKQYQKMQPFEWTTVNNWTRVKSNSPLNATVKSEQWQKHQHGMRNVTFRSMKETALWIECFAHRRARFLSRKYSACFHACFRRNGNVSCEIRIFRQNARERRQLSSSLLENPSQCEPTQAKQMSIYFQLIYWLIYSL